MRDLLDRITRDLFSLRQKDRHFNIFSMHISVIYFLFASHSFSEVKKEKTCEQKPEESIFLLEEEVLL